MKKVLAVIRLNLMSERDKSRIFARLIERKVEYWKKANEKRENVRLHVIYILRSTINDYFWKNFFKYNRRQRLRIGHYGEPERTFEVVSSGCIMLSLNFDVGLSNVPETKISLRSGIRTDLFDGSKSVISWVGYNLKCVLFEYKYWISFIN